MQQPLGDLARGAARAGFDWPDGPRGLTDVFAKVDEEIAELREAISDAGTTPQPTAEMTAEVGDLLFSLVNLARRLKVNPEESLRQTTNRFTTRFHFIEQQAALSERTVNDLSLAEMDHYWEEAKRLESPQSADTTPALPPSTGETRALT